MTGRAPMIPAGCSMDRGRPCSRHKSIISETPRKSQVFIQQRHLKQPQKLKAADYFEKLLLRLTGKSATILPSTDMTAQKNGVNSKTVLCNFCRHWLSPHHIRDLSTHCRKVQAPSSGWMNCCAAKRRSGLLLHRQHWY